MERPLLITILLFGTVFCERADMFDTIVIGLGAAGTTAAAILAKAGRRVLALEAQNRVGGRVKTVPFGDGLVEEGAEWIHGTQGSRVYDLAIQNNLTVVPQDLNFEVYRSDGSLGDSALVGELIEYALSVSDNPPNVAEPLGDFITRKVKDYIKTNKPELLQDPDFIAQFLSLANLIVNNLEASNDWNDVSTETKYKELGGHQHYSWHRLGYKTFFELLLNTYNNGPGLPTLTIKLNTEVTKIHWPQNPEGNVVVTTKDGQNYTASNVIVTVSLGVLKERAHDIFTPSLTIDKLYSIDRLSIGVVGKIIFDFPHIWLGNASWGVYLWKGKDLKEVPNENNWLKNISSYSRPQGCDKCMTLWITGETAKLVETMPEDVVKTKVIELLRRFMGANTTIPEPVSILRSSWYSNPFTRGSYTFDNLSIAKYPNSRLDLQQPLLDSAGNPRVLFAGEATNLEHFSTVHGASETGFREASRLLRVNSKI